jgi:diacylglycerol kinase/membrane-associated phospholipid phosphatase
VAAFFLIAALLGKAQPLDAFLYQGVAALRSPLATAFFHGCTALASPAVLLLVCFAIVLGIRRHEYRVPLMLNLILCILLNLSLKNLFQRARPADVMALAVESGYSFPSGHAMSAACFYGFLIFLTWRLCRSRPKKALLMGLLSAVILLVGISRVYLGVHFFSDVLGSFFVSVGYLIAYTALVEKYIRHPEADAPKPLSGKGSFLKSFSYAFEGVAAGLTSERNMIVHFGVMMTVVVFGAILHLALWEWMVCILLFGLVFMAELFNTAIETTVDIAMPQKDPRAKIAKDTSAGAVLVISIAAALIGGMIFVPKLFPLIWDVLG